MRQNRVWSVVLVAAFLAMVALAAPRLEGVRAEAQGFAAWTRVATPQDTGGPHAGLQKVVYANPIAAKAWRGKGALPPGSIVVKTAGSSAQPSFVAVMVKRASGWYYEEYFPKNGRYSVGAGGPGKQAQCSACHADAARDALFTRP